MIKFGFYLDFAREEAWLSEMARGGYELTGVFAWYTFQPCEPRDAVYRIDHRLFRNKAEFANYCAMFEDSGWRHVAGWWNSGSQYFIRVDPNAGEDIFSDAYSKAGRFKRMADLWLVMGAVMLAVDVALMLTGAVDMRALIEPSRLYLTPGLWERAGEAFWRAFWFETPFALMRAGGLVFYPIALAAYVYFAVRSWQLYKKEISHEE